MKKDITATSSSEEEQKAKEDITVTSSASEELEVVERSLSEFWFWLLLISILLLASIIRLYALDIYPQRFNQDAMLIGYDGWSIWTTGRDQHGAFFPVLFRSFMANDLPVSHYVTAPFVGILGLNEANTRLPFALMGITTVFLVALLGRQWFNSRVGLLAALLLTIDPWHINYSRIAQQGSCVPFFIVVGLYCFTRGTSLFVTKGRRQSRAPLWLAGSAFSFALLTGSYQPLELEVPLLLCACTFAVFPFVRNKLSHLGWADVFSFLALYCLFVCPLVIAQLQDWNLAYRRLNGITILDQPDWLILFLTQYANAYNPGGLFFTGFGGGLQVLPQGVGQLFWLEWPLWIFAVIGMSQQRHISRQAGFVVPALLAIWFVTFPIASSLTTDSPHEIRTINFLPLPEILAGYGAVVAWEMLHRCRWKWFSAAQVALVISAIVLSIFNLMFLSFFFSPPLLQTDATAKQIPYNVGLRPVLTKVMQQAKPCDTVWLESTNQTYVYYLFLTRYPPHVFQSTAQKGDTFWAVSTSVGQVHFGTPDTQVVTASLPAGCQGKASRTFFITRKAQIESGWQQIIAVSNHAGVPIWQALVNT